MIGIGGAGMSALARLAAQSGYRVTGSDRADSPVLAALRDLGVGVVVGHDAASLPADIDTLVVSTAIGADNPERSEARRRGVEEIHRAEFLAELMGGHRGLAVAGAHGKSTTSAMLAMALGDVSVCVGADIEGGGGTGARWGEGPWFVAEADESDRSLLRLAPEAAILLNVDHDHHSTFATLREVEETFAAFLDRLPPDGPVVAGPDPGAWALARASGRPAVLVGEGGDWRVSARAGGAGLLEHRDGMRVSLSLAVPGVHNAGNAACAVALAHWCGVDPQTAADRLARFHGVGRRYELRGVVAGITVVDDYAHHPTELRATLAAARERTSGRIVAVFQPHLYSRTRALADQLGDALGGADVAIVTDVYGAREAPDPAVTGRLVVEAVPAPTRAVYAPSLSEARDAALAAALPGDLVLTLGAGDVTRLGQEMVGVLENQHGDGGDSGGTSHPA